MRLSRNHILAVLAAALTMTCGMSIYAPIRFDKQLAVRERIVKERLIKIRYAEEKYRKVYGTYADDFDKLVKAGCLADSMRFIPFSGGKTLLSSSMVMYPRSLPFSIRFFTALPKVSINGESELLAS